MDNQDEHLFLTLVPYNERCLELSWDWLRDPEIRALTLSPEFTREEQQRFFESLSGRPDYHIWGVAAGGEIVGAAGIKNVRGNIAEYWGYLGRRELWGKGLGQLMVAAVEQEARKLGLRKLYLRVSPSNSRAIGLYQKVGFAECNGTSADIVRMMKGL